MVIDIISIQKLLPEGIIGDVHIKVGSVATVDKASGCRIRRTNDETPHKVDKEEEWRSSVEELTTREGRKRE